MMGLTWRTTPVGTQIGYQENPVESRGAASPLGLGVRKGVLSVGCVKSLQESLWKNKIQFLSQNILKIYNEHSNVANGNTLLDILKSVIFFFYLLFGNINSISMLWHCFYIGQKEISLDNLEPIAWRSTWAHLGMPCNSGYCVEKPISFGTVETICVAPVKSALPLWTSEDTNL